MTNEEIAQKWVEGIPVVQTHLEIINNKKVWQETPGEVLAATNRLGAIKNWAIKVMEAWPPMREKFLEDIERRQESGHHHPAAQAQNPHPHNRGEEAE